MPSADVAIVAALSIELDPIRDRLSDHIIERGQFRVDTGRLAGRPVTLIESGPGEDDAVRACRAVVMTYRPRWVMSAGVAGGLVDELTVGDVIVADEVVHETTRESVTFVGSPRPLSNAQQDNTLRRLITATQPVLDETEKRHLAAEFGAHVVDMESYGVAKWCSDNSVRCVSIRSISDAVTDSLPSIVNSLVGFSAWEQVGRVTGTALRKPSIIKDLWQLRSRALEAADRLADAVFGFVSNVDVSSTDAAEFDPTAIENLPSDKNCP